MYAASYTQKMPRSLKYSFDEYQERTKNETKKTKHDRRSKRELKRNFEY